MIFNSKLRFFIALVIPLFIAPFSYGKLMRPKNDSIKVETQFNLNQECGISKAEPISSFPFREIQSCLGKVTKFDWSPVATQLEKHRIYLAMNLDIGELPYLQMNVVVTSWHDGQIVSHVETTNVVSSGDFEFSTFIPENTDKVLVSIQTIYASGKFSIQAIRSWKSKKIFNEGQMCDECHRRLEHVFERIDKEYLYPERISMEKIRKGAIRAATGAQKPDELASAIKEVVRQLPDYHSKFLSASEINVFKAQMRNALQSGKSDSENLISTKLLQNNVGYIRLQSFSGVNADMNKEYVSEIMTALKDLNQRGARKWIIDLRDHGGGSVPPLIAGMRPLLGHGAVGYFIFAKNVKVPWLYGEEGDTSGENYSIDPKLSFEGSAMPVAVLTSGHTASSAEALVVTFLKRENTRSFGESTAGYTTGVHDPQFKDGSVLGITSSEYADRTEQVVEGRIVPDETIATHPNEIKIGQDPILDASLVWLKQF